MAHSMRLRISRSSRGLRGTLQVPGDKSITHRALLLAAIASGTSRVAHPLRGGVVDSMCGCLQALGAEIHWPDAETVVVHSRAWRSPGRPLDCTTSGTTMRLLMGALAGSAVGATLTGAERLRMRPMARVAVPLRLMGARISAPNGDDQPPLRIEGSPLRGIEYQPPVPSAQVKSALLLAGLSAAGATIIHEPVRSRDHTERLLRHLGVQIARSDSTLRLDPPAAPLPAFDIDVPGDFSAAAFLLAAAALVPGSDVALPRLGLNPTRTGLLEALGRMGGSIEAGNTGQVQGEPVGKVVVRHAMLQAIEVDAGQVAAMVDEIPILAVLATQAHGETRVRGAGELRLKESDRLLAMAVELCRLGAEIEQIGDGLIINGPTRLVGAQVDSHGDHRVAMALAVAGLVASGETVVHGAQAIRDSYPGFGAALRALGADIA